jgi:subtilisin family serine protease
MDKHTRSQRLAAILLLVIIALSHSIHVSLADSLDPQTLPPPGAEIPENGSELVPLYLVQGIDVVPDEYIVVMKPGFQVGQNRESLRGEVAALGGQVLSVYDVLLNGFAAKLPPQALNALRRNPNVDFIEPNQVITLEGVEVAQAEVGLLGTQTDPTWGLDRVDQRNLPLDDVYQYDNLANSVHIYVIDTGLRTTHQEFAGRVLEGRNFSSDDRTDIEDCNGHGTHVTGTIAGTTYGVAKGALIHPVRVFGCSGSTTSTIILDALTWIINHLQKPAVVNMSLGGGSSPTLDWAVNNLINLDVVVAVSAGNSATDACTQSPARVPAAITIGSTDNKDKKAISSNFGTCLDLFAPGVSITSAGISSDSATTLMSGTSMASPHAAGAAALYLQIFPVATPAEVSTYLTTNATTGVVSSAGAGSPNLLLFTRMMPAPLRPRGYIFNDNPTFMWTNLADADQFEVQLFERDPDQLVDSAIFTPAVCGQNTCSAVPGFSLSIAVGDYQWQLRTFVNGAWGDWSEWMPFNLVEPQYFYTPLFLSP